MNINEVIQFKEYHQDITTPLPMFSGNKRGNKSTCEIPFIYFSLYLQAKKALLKTQLSGQIKCHECSAQAGRAVYHYERNYFEEFKEKYKKHLPTLQRITDNKY